MLDRPIYATRSSPVGFAPVRPNPHTPLMGGQILSRTKSGKPRRPNILSGKPNCGVGAGGFKPGNTCGVGKRKALAVQLKDLRQKANVGLINPSLLRKHALLLRDHRRGRDHGQERHVVMEAHRAIKTGDIPLHHDGPREVAGWKPKLDSEFEDLGDDIEAGHDWGMNSYQSWRYNMDSDQINALKYYTGSGYFPMNDYLRGFRDNGSYETKESVEHLQSALKINPVPSPVVVYRGVDSEIFEHIGITHPSQLKVGTPITLKGFTSTSLSSSVAEKFGAEDGMLMRIHVPRGAQAGYADAGKKSPARENELILQHDSKFRVVKTQIVDTPEQKYWQVTLEMLLHDNTK